ncbi:FxSxx-COOH system tetratricopeptide repeat protein [Ktedonospora formicarum]|uniref:Tetratricopeptide repeat protein n=1 Tax=Ktedonospora formicarum TaxID=2778364 RepID=A0A8J3MS99_9CHLR|nr:FxSxx-COOH system tetratricopeptide repeat protein [Ktedonospora formicarum]GHO46872.1 tetratricopeptide repeat protein [Ktedonospora formicarum]
MSFGDRLREERLRRHLSQEALAEALALSARSIRRWEQGQAIPQASVRVQLSRFFGLSLEELFEDQKKSSSHTLHWCVPYTRNPFFTGREEYLTALHTSLYTNQEAESTHVYALYGLGGVGKTQIALEYAYRFAKEFSAIFWIGAETNDSLTSSLLQIAKALQLPECDDRDQQRVMTAVRHWLTTHSQWLLIFDNVDDLGILDLFLPSARHGAVLLTTRLQILGTRARGMQLLPMEHEEGMLFLLCRAKVLEADATNEQVLQLSVQKSSLYAVAVNLVTLMGGLPLALDQAGAYLEETQCGLPAYLELFHTRRTILLHQRGEGGQNHPMPVSTTFALAITATAERHPAVGDLLRVCTLLQPDAIPEELFRQGGTHLGPILGTVCSDVLDWNRVIALACSYSLLSRQPEAQTFSIHRLVQAVHLDTMTETERQEWTRRIIEALDVVLPEVQPTTEYPIWKQCERLLPHALLCLNRLTVEDSLALASLAYKTAQYLRERGRYMEAEPLYLRALRIQEQILGPEHLKVAALLNYLAALYWNQGKYAEAEKLLQRALSIWEQSPDHDQLNIARAQNNLGNLSWEQGKYAEAEPRYQQALHIWKQTWGSDHPNVATSLNNLAELYRMQGKYTEAEPRYQQALAIREQNLGSSHPEVATSLNNLAELYRMQNKYAKAEPLYQRATSIREQILGRTHPLVAEPLNGLANLYRDQEEYVKAEPIYQQALAIREQHLGRQHPETAQSLHDLAIFFQRQGKLREARSLVEQALEIRSQSLGNVHPKTIEAQELSTQLAQELKHTEEGAKSQNRTEEASG